MIHRLAHVSLFVMSILLVARLPVMAQEAAPPEPEPEPTITLDIEALLEHDNVEADSVSDQVWTLSAQPGRRLVQLPLIVEPAEQAVELAGPPVTLRGGRFLAWNLSTNDQPGVGRTQRGPVTPRSIGSRNPRDLLLPGGKIPGQNTPYPPAATPDTFDPTGASDGLLPDGVPRFTRRITVEPDGTIKWELDRFIPGGEIADNAQERYALKIRPDLLEEQAPQRPGAQQRGQSRQRQPRPSGTQRRDPDAAREQQARRRAEQAEYRDQLRAFQELRNQVRDLPDEFAMPMPPRLWAVFEIPGTASSWSFAGEEPLPWQIDVDDFQLLRELASGRGGSDTTANAQIAQLQQLARDDHPLTHRVIALSLARSQMAGQAQPNDALYRLLETLLRCEDSQARLAVLQALAETDPRTDATMSLARDAYESLTPHEKQWALRVLLEFDPSDSGQMQKALAGVNEALADENGADAGDVLAAVVEAIGDPQNPRGARRSRNASGSVDVIALVANGVRFDGLSPTRREQAIAYVIRAAGAEPLAADWMDHGLLGSSDPAVVRSTLELINAAAAPAPVVETVVRWINTAVFSEPEGGAAEAVDLNLSGPIPIDSTSHSIFRALSSGNPELRDLAWRALANFIIDDADTARQTRQRQRRPNPNADDEPDPHTLILDAALAQNPTPRSVAIFFANQPDLGAGTAALVRIVAEADEPAAAQAARKLRGSGRTLGDALGSLDADQRGRFGANLYRALTGQPAMVAGLLREPNERSTVVTWFGGEVARGVLPEPGQWASQYRDDTELLTLAGNSDTNLANGAVAALVGAAGGDDDAAATLAHSFANHGDRSADGLKELWASAKQEIYARRLGEAVGMYRLVLVIGSQGSFDIGRRSTPASGPIGPYGPGYDPAFPGPYGPADGMPTTGGPGGAGDLTNAELTITLGVVELVADQQQVRFAGDPLELAVPQEYLAIRIDRAVKLKNFEDEDLADVDLDGIRDPLDLMPQPNGSWRGRVTMRDGRILQLTMEPVDAP